ncbi:MAG: hypothetical protein EDM05_009580 [Leptolyngbya sp. IPPAS B-1204]
MITAAIHTANTANPATTDPTGDHLRAEVEKLAAEAFHQHLISGYGDGESPDEYQIVLQGKPRHYSLEYAHSLLANLIEHQISLVE